MTSLFLVVELILAIFLERTTKKDTTNSSKPSSQTGKDESALGRAGSHGKSKADNKAAAHNRRTVETVTLSKALTCDVCGEDLTDVPCVHVERRTKIDIVFEKVVEHVDAEIKQCPTCEATVKGRFPADLHGPLQYGYGLSLCDQSSGVPNGGAESRSEAGHLHTGGGHCRGDLTEIRTALASGLGRLGSASD